MKVFHLSHIDLDGYSCQLLSSKCYKDVEFYNANYGNEVTARLKEIEDDINNTQDKQIFILITDLNLSDNECQIVNQIYDRLKFLNIDVTLQLLDHHKTGLKQSKKYKWYHLDTTKSATLLTYEYLIKNGCECFDTTIKNYVEAVNAFDIWKEDNEWFEFGKVLNRYVNDSKEVAKMLFKNESATYKIEFLKTTFKYIANKEYIIMDDDLIKNKKKILSSNNQDTLDNLVLNYITNLLTNNKDKMEIYYQNYKGILTSQIGNTSVIGNGFLKANPDFYFFMDVAPSGNVSLRADNNLDVSSMASKLFGGGGHPNASGGKMGKLKDVYTYKKLKEIVQDFIDKNQSHK